MESIKLYVDGKEYVPTGEQEKPVAVTKWYDRYTRLWVVYKVDQYGYQYGDAQYVYGKKEAERTANEFVDEIKEKYGKCLIAK